MELAERQLKLQVIYGDTDSVMIYTGLEDLDEVLKVRHSLYPVSC